MCVSPLPVYMPEEKNASSEHTIFAYLNNQKKDECSYRLACFDYSFTCRHPFGLHREGELSCSEDARLLTGRYTCILGRVLDQLVLDGKAGSGTSRTDIDFAID